MATTPRAQEDADATAPRPRVQSAARTVGILLAIARSDHGLTTKEISEEVGIGRQATYHLLHTLTAMGMVTRDDRNRYLLGLRVGTLAEGFARQLAPAERLAPVVRALAHETGEMSYASGWWEGEIMTLSIARGTNPVQAAEVPRGYGGHAHARASGKLLLALASDATRDAYLSHHELEPRTPNTITDRDALEREFAEIRERGFAVDREEFAIGLACLAVPFDRRSPFVLAVAGPSDRMLEHEQEYLASLRRAAASLPAEID
jgi:IclR family transcriptional regulator, acetate operon repressor